MRIHTGTRRCDLRHPEAVQVSAQYPAYLEWPELRRAILQGGGIGPSPDWSRDWYPADLYRRRGPAPDLVAAETLIVSAGAHGVVPWASSDDGNFTPNDSAMFCYLQRAYEEWQRWQAERTRRQARYVDVYQLAREHGLSLRTVWNVARDARLQARRGPVPRRTYFEARAFAQALAETPRAPRIRRERMVEELAA